MPSDTHRRNVLPIWEKAMKCLRYLGLGWSRNLALCEVQKPNPGPGDILIEVRATSINPIDWKLRQGILGLAGDFGFFPKTPCFDCVGVVVEVGKSVSSAYLGKRVFGMLSFKEMGAATEYLIAGINHFVVADDTIEDAVLAGLPLAGMTALQSLRDLGELKSGQRLLITGGSGGVGHLAVQLGKVLGAEVTVLAGPTNQLFVESLGADHIYDYTRTPRPEGPFDVIFDTVADHGFHYWKSRLTPEGTFVSVLPKLSNLLAARLSLLRGQRTVRIIGVKPQRSDLELLQNLVLRHRLKIEIDRIIPLKRIDEALDKSRAGRTRGKIIIEIRS